MVTFPSGTRQSFVVASTPRVQRSTGRALVVPIIESSGPWAVFTAQGTVAIDRLATLVCGVLGETVGTLTDQEFRAVKRMIAKFVTG